ncbi:hypothetical protein FOZ63_017416 [Perkinsus olseni]|uniref:Uncharacterized protein n=1 Tax=Perkinsus olseni TaxID=32597 RepID=A0A7J6Q570_PEROL|nr:hypothetical protein FOZ62_004639 [Perkinsus olseni]KAF4719313.1 hypothetical protein FOZ63_017416 [Perkinsus olseni]
MVYTGSRIPWYRTWGVFWPVAYLIGVPTLLYIGHRVKRTLDYELDFATARETWKYTSKPEAIREPVPERVRDDRKDVQ